VCCGKLVPCSWREMQASGRGPSNFELVTELVPGFPIWPLGKAKFYPTPLCSSSPAPTPESLREVLLPLWS
jgi:hypothetical protein